jgi:anti-sigma B factor antagonist
VTDKQPEHPPPFSIERAQAPEGAVLLVVTGEIDLATSGRFRSHIEQAVAGGARLLVVDLTEVTFMESTMLRELLRARDDLDQVGARMVIAGAGLPVRRLLDLTGTTGLFSFTETRSEALSTLS